LELNGSPGAHLQITVIYCQFPDRALAQEAMRIEKGENRAGHRSQPIENAKSQGAVRLSGRRITVAAAKPASTRPK
jgi:hypothetical protein